MIQSANPTSFQHLRARILDVRALAKPAALRQKTFNETFNDFFNDRVENG
jgi:hypothetical protein